MFKLPKRHYITS